jgi:hypothetical protein
MEILSINRAASVRDPMTEAAAAKPAGGRMDGRARLAKKKLVIKYESSGRLRDGERVNFPVKGRKERRTDRLLS